MLHAMCLFFTVKGSNKNLNFLLFSFQYCKYYSCNLHTEKFIGYI